VEKIKDIMYDISDIVISLIIITVIFFVISWKLNESMPISYEPKDTPVASESNDSTPSDSIAEADNSVIIEFADEERPVENNPGTTVSTEVVETPVVPEPEPTPEPVNTTPAKEVMLEIPSGSTGFAIAKLLKDHGFIDDINGFISKVETMGLGAKLRSGEFKLKTNMTEEQIIKIIAGVRD
jgi:cytoskeletal protein RodZ